MACCGAYECPDCGALVIVGNAGVAESYGCDTPETHDCVNAAAVDPETA